MKIRRHSTLPELAMAAILLPFTLFLPFVASSRQFLQYGLNRTIYNSGSILNLDNGLKGRPTPFTSNASASEDATHGMFFVSQDGKKYSLAVLAYDSNSGDSYSGEVIWRANQSRGVGDGAVLELGLDGNMLLKDFDGEIVWQTGTQNRGVRQLEVSDRGNVILANFTNDKIWMTFDSPSDTLICTQVLKQGMHLSNGDYSLVLDNTRLALYYKSSFKYQEWNWNSGLLNSSNVIYLALCCDGSKLALQLRSDYVNVNQFNKLVNVTSCSSAKSVVNTLLEMSTSNQLSYAAFVKLDSDGQLEASKWVIKKQQFQTCDLPRSCGPYGLCNRSTCNCPDYAYFEFTDPSKPESGCKKLSNYSINTGSCKSLTPPIEGIGYIATKYTNYSICTLNQCRNLCLQDQSCQAGFYQNHTNKCFQFNEIETLRTENSSYVAFFRICTESKSSSLLSTKASLLVGVLVGLFILTILPLVAIYIICRLRRFDANDYDDEDGGMLKSMLSETALRRFTYKELEEITMGFSDLLGRGGFGPVHKGILANGQLVAVKKLDSTGQSMKEFYAEVSVLSRVHHMNLVQLIGFCAERTRRALIYEYMPNGSLDRWLYNSDDKLSTLDWQTRLDIAVGAGKGIAYLHEECNERIVHFDVKPQNILLTESFYPKVGDFGLSKLMDRDQSFVMTTVRGTRGYLAPEWFTEGSTINEKSDVYSFGVVLLELVGGSKPKDVKTEDLWNWSHSDKEMEEFVDKRMVESLDFEQAKWVLRIAALCVNRDPSARPAMSDVVAMLEGRIEVPDLKTDSTCEIYKTFEVTNSALISVVDRDKMFSPR